MRAKTTYHPLVKLVILLVLLGCISTSWGQPAGYNYRKRILVESDSISGTSPLSNYPILVSLTDNDFRTIANGGGVENNSGYDIIVTTLAGAPLDQELQYYDPVTGTIIMWVRVGSLPATTDVQGYFYYGNSSIFTDQSTTSTWSSDFVGVWHLDDLKDATGNNADLINNATITNTSGQIGSAREFDGDGDDLQDGGGDIYLDGLTNYTLSLWAKADGTGSDRGLLHGREPTGNDNRIQIRYDAAGQSGGGTNVYRVNIRVDDNGSKTNQILESSNSSQSTAWQHIVVTRSDGNPFKLYIDGVEDTPTYTNAQTGETFGNSKFIIGRGAKDGTTSSWDGLIDEVRIENVERDADWIQTTYTNQNDPGSFFLIQNVNDVAVLADMEGVDLNYSTLSGPQTITGATTLSDFSDVYMDSVIVSISANYQSAEDTLLFTTQNGITAVWNDGIGTLRLSGNARTTQYQTALRTVKYENSSGSPTTSARTIEFQAHDGDAYSNMVSRDIVFDQPNSAPVLAAIEGGTLAYLDSYGDSTITASITVSDADDAYLDSARISLSANYANGEDILDFVNTGSISASWSSVDGELILYGSALVADYQAALRAVTYRNVNPDPSTATRTVSFEIKDGDDWSNTVSRDLSVTPLNNAPELSGIEAASILYNAGDGAVAITDSIIVSDGDDTNMDSARVKITGNYFDTEDELAYSTQFGVTGTFDSVNGEIILRGSTTKANYQTILRSVTYENTATTPKTPTRTIQFVVHDGDAFSNFITRSIASGAPGTISDLELWMRADAGVYSDAGATLATDGQGIQQWHDQSGADRDFIDNTTPPVWRETVASLNNASAIEFAGTGDHFRDGDGEDYINGLTEFSLFAVIESDVTSTDRGWWSTRNPGADREMAIRYDAVGDNSGENNVIKAGILANSSSNQLEGLADIQSTDPQIVSLNWESGVAYEIWVDGVLNNPSSQPPIPGGTIANALRVNIGQGAASALESWDGMIAEVILYSRNLTSTEREKIQEYLSEKYGISVGLIEPATGGDSLSADDVGGSYTTLTGPRITEDVVGELSASGTLILEAPSGFEWDTGGGNPGVSIQPAYGASTDLAVSYTGRTSTQVTFTISTASASPNKPGEVTFSDLRIRPTTGSLPSTGDITNAGTTGPSGSVNLGTLNTIPGAATDIVFVQAPPNGNTSTDLTPAVTVQLQDQYGNDVALSDTSVSISKTTGNGTLSGTLTQLTDETGLATFDDLQIDQVGTKRLTATTATLGSVESADFTISGVGVYTTFLVERVSGGDILTQTAGSAFSIKISAVDAVESVDTDFTGTVDLSSTSSVVSGGGTTASFTAGVLSSHAITLGTAGSHTITATVTSGSEFGTSNSFTINPGSADPATTIIEALPTVIASNGIATSTVTVTVKDAGGNILTDGGETVNLVTTSGTLLSSVVDQMDGTYTQSLQSATSPATAQVTGLLNAVGIGDTAYVQFNNYSTIWQSSLGASDTTHEWSRASNWSNGIPGASDAVLVPATPAVGTRQPIIEVDNLQVASLTVETAADVTLTGGISFDVIGDLTGGGEVNGSTQDTISVGGQVDIGNFDIGLVVLDGSGNQSVTAAFDYDNLEINSSAAVKPTDNLSVDGTLVLTGGVLEIPSGKSLIANTQSITSGKIRSLREVSGTTGWRLMGAPVISDYGDFLDSIFTQGYTGSDSSSGSPSVLWYDETYVGSDNQRWRRPSNITDATVPGRGLFIYVFGDIAGEPAYSQTLPVVLDVTGDQDLGTAGEFEFDVSYTATADTGWNLLANPFPATIDWDGTGWTKTNMDNIIYVWDGTLNSGNGGYLTWNGTTGSLGDGKIPPFQGFWVKANADPPALALDVSNKTTGGVFYKVTEPQPFIMFHIDSDTLEASTHLAFSGNGSLGRDPYDAFRLQPFSDTYLDIYTSRKNGEDLWINNLPIRFGVVLEIPVGVQGWVAGEAFTDEITLKWPQLTNLPDEWELTLTDEQTGVEFDLRSTVEYQFTPDAQASPARNSPLGDSPRVRNSALARGSVSNGYRFTLRIDPGDAFPEIPRNYGLGDNYPNPFNPSTRIPFDLPLENSVTITIYDVLGRRVSNLEENAPYPAGRHEVTWNAEGHPSGVYFYRVQIGNRTYSKKMLLLR